MADERCSELVTAIMELLDDAAVTPDTAGQILEDLERWNGSLWGDLTTTWCCEQEFLRVTLIRVHN